MGIAYAQQAGSSSDGGPASILPVLLPSVLIFVIFYFLMIRPQQKKQQEQKDMLANLKTGDQIVTTGGLYGTIVKFGDDNRVKVRIAENVTVEIARSAITEKPTGTTEAAKGKGN
ncbi:preprotein translocase (YajC) [Candidatus Methylomirabilis lanthanidiphila]|uniref:Preprotein translocase (YajC) n=1 Tax=Candidatus Methylomirabilis lanthanidiphila TaxID=2211376 RepID=A0A564ZG04_9BACT|nr:preprotein translocase subunit YajC [Candidatus Methylomirabilis lanthanidiphila]VUZ84214.1 preprotein translocase (YajC) [Candidatus Methylomirabilis lanthanidiphila]